jgi:predicted dehydrogenase
MKSAAMAGAGLIILPSGTLRGQNAPSNKLNVALIGVWGRGTAHYNVLANENVAALCDVNENRLKEGLQIFPNAKTYWDWRKCLDQPGLDAVIICTADHHHAFICNWALNRNLHVYCEKPLGITVEESRIVRDNYLKRRDKLATQHGTQRHAFPNFERLRELILDGAIGELKSVSSWDSRQNGRPGYPPGQGMPPAFFHYEQWIGPSTYRPYSPQYFAAPGAGNNCLQWNPYRDFGVGQMGDMGAHTMDLVWNCIDAGAPTAIEVDQEFSDKYDPDINPVKLKVTFEHPKNAWRGPITVEWYQGGLKPYPPKNYIDVMRIGNGAIFEGTKGFIVADFNSRMIIPNDNDGDMTYYKRRAKEELLPLVGNVAPAAAAGGRGGPRRGVQVAPPRGAATQQPPGGPGGARGGRDPYNQAGFAEVPLLEGGVPPALGSPNQQAIAATKVAQAGGAAPRGGGRAGGTANAFQQEWLDACKGLNNRRTHCDFDYSGTMMEQMLLGLVAHRVGKKLQYDPATGRITNVPEANEFLGRKYRTGWTLNG